MNTFLKISAMACAVTIGFSACSKDDKDPVVQEYAAKVYLKDGESKDYTKVSTTKNTEGAISRKGTVYAVRNLRQFELDADGKVSSKAASNYFFDFKENDATTEADAMVVLPATTAAILKSNTSKGYSLSYINKAFETVTAKDEFTAAKDNLLGLESKHAKDVIGWLTYTSSPNHQVLPVVDRTIIILKDGKALFKFRVNSVYSNGAPEKEVAPTNSFFYSIDYQEFK